MHTPALTRTHPHTPHKYPLMPADALNLINHMKLHVNEKRGKKERAESSWVELSWAELSLVELSWAELSWVELSRAKSS